MSENDAQNEVLRSATIMMVDDEPTTLDVLEAFLRGEGYENFVPITDSRTALTMLEELRPDVLLLDLMMPEVDGLQILEAMRLHPQLRQTPVVILTSSTDSPTKLKALQLGATDFLGKPVDPSELALRLRNTLAAKAYQDRLAYYDGLTGLPNRQLFVERMERLLERVQREDSTCAVMHLNLDRFQQINDALGREVGNSVLKAVGERLDRCVRPSDFTGTARFGGDRVLSRSGGDEFLLFLLDVGVADRVARVAERILAQLAKPYSVDGHELHVAASIGLALFPDDGGDAETLLGHASAALSQAKSSRRNGFQFYSEALNAECRERLHLEGQLRKALDRQELVLYYQPKLEVASSRVVGAEALMRWQHPELGLVPPNRFIPIAEESDLIDPMGTWALEKACWQSRSWQGPGSEPLAMAVNVSAKQFHCGNLLAAVEAAIRTSELDPKYLTLELTESMIMENPEETARILSELKAFGITLSIDDFGTGYSSLSTLKRFPIDELKIDMSFVKGIPHDPDDSAIVSAIVAMSHTLGMKVVAEGVETEEQLAFLEELGCDQYQGFLCSRPLPPEDWLALLEQLR